MNELKFQGVIKHIEDVKTKDGADWKSLKFQVEEKKDQYPQVGNFSYFKKGENVKYVDDFANMYPLGTEVVVTFNLSTSEWQGKYYSDVRAWKIEKLNSGGSQNIDQGNIPLENEETINPDDIPF